MIDRIYECLWAMFHPAYWLQQNPYSSAWDAELRRRMLNHRFVIVDEYTAKLGTLEIWTANYPYSSFHPYRPKRVDVSPKRITIHMAKKKMMEDAVRILIANTP